ncbi:MULTISPECIES: ThiF family adenylyltransferase [Gilliamella]|nr:MULTISPECIES: ThiF family adenylyltransferase [Gilliamella]MBI0059929.1 ThiF family adenylyltransferase [Gilliamella sp. M0320]PXY93636.1 hypothetical protein DKK77_03175 [Gilliamella apis]
MSFTSEIRQTFLAYNFKAERKPPKYEVSYWREFDTKLGIFRIGFSNIHTDMSQLPEAYLLALPEHLKKIRLPHLNANKSICYLDPETTNLNPIDAKRAIATCIQLIERIIGLWVSGDYKEEIEAEFSSYWEHENFSFIMTDDPIGIAANYKRTNLDGNEILETVIAKDITEAQQWAKFRGAKSILKDYLAIIVYIRKSLYVPYETIWPPQSFKDFLHWLDTIDRNALQNLIHKIANNIKKQHDIFIVLRKDNESIGIKILLSNAAKKMFERIKRKRKQKGQPLFKLQNVINVLSGMYFIEKFTRVEVADVSPDFLFQRNSLDDISLKNKKIALIGCGTIGGYSAHSLIQCGAGSGNGSLHLFDDDILTSGNLGRHILGVKYLKEIKSKALKHYLEEQGFSIEIYHHPAKFTKNDMTKKWDIIIDVTGDETFSLLLAYWFRTDRINYPCSIIHGWIDAYGKAVRILKDNKEGGCYGCLFTYQNQERKERFPLFGKNNIPEHNLKFKRKCGKTYMPFNSQPSLTLAGMIQTMTLSVINKDSSNFCQQSLTTDVRQYKAKKLTFSKNCPICQK